MKFEIDTILYIVISIIIIAASTLGKKKRKRAQQAPQQPQTEGGEQPEGGEETEDFKFGAFSEIKSMFETVTEPGDPGMIDEYAREDKLEQIVDEEEGILDEEETLLKARERITHEEEVALLEKEEKEMQQRLNLEESTLYEVEDREGGIQGDDESEEEGFFNNPSDIRKAIIYSEILKRPEY